MKFYFETRHELLSKVNPTLGSKSRERALTNTNEQPALKMNAFATVPSYPLYAPLYWTR